MSGAIFRTELSWPAIVAYEMGLSADEFTFPVYESPTGPGGLPLDLERLARGFESRFGDRLSFWELFPAAAWVRGYLDEIEDYWERGEGSNQPAAVAALHNMAVYGWDLVDALVLDADTVRERIAPARDNTLRQIVENHGSRAAWRVLERARTAQGKAQTVFDTVAEMGNQTGGIETLIVALGSNNALGSVLSLEPRWTPASYGDLDLADRLDNKRDCNVWRPAHFDQEWAQLVQQVRAANARHVIFATVPSVTIAPIARGVCGKVSRESRYFKYYTRPWINDRDFQPKHDAHLTEDEARAIDSAIDAYNDTIIASVRAARQDGLDWYVFDLGGLLDSLAVRRYIESPWTRPTWWKPYPLPPELAALDPVPNVRYFRADSTGRTDGGLISLDGVHPTTIGYGVIAQEVIRIMCSAGVEFRDRAGNLRPLADPQGTVTVDFGRLLATDTLLTRPPAVISNTLGLLGWLDERLDWVKRIVPFAPIPA